MTLGDKFFPSYVAVESIPKVLHWYTKKYSWHFIDEKRIENFDQMEFKEMSLFKMYIKYYCGIIDGTDENFNAQVDARLVDLDGHFV